MFQVRVTRSALSAREKSLRDGCVLEVVSPLRTVPSEVVLRLGGTLPVKLPILGGSRHLLVDVEDPSVHKGYVKGSINPKLQTLNPKPQTLHPKP